MHRRALLAALLLLIRETQQTLTPAKSSLESIKELCPLQPGSQKRLLVMGRVLNAASQCRQRIGNSVVRVSLAVDDKNICQGESQVGENGNIAIFIPVPTLAMQKDASTLPALIKVCSDGAACQLDYIQLRASPGSVQPTGVPNHAGGSKVLIADLIANGSDDYYLLITDFCLDADRSAQIAQTLKQSNHIPDLTNTDAVVNSHRHSKRESDAARARWLTIMDGMKRGTFSDDQAWNDAYSGPWDDAMADPAYGVRRLHHSTGPHFHDDVDTSRYRNGFGTGMNEQVMPGSDSAGRHVKVKRFLRDTALAPRSSVDESEDSKASETYKKDSWDASVMGWMKRNAAVKRNWEDSGMAWIKRRDNTIQQNKMGSPGGISGVVPEAKRNWDDSGMSWIKRPTAEAQKKDWSDSGMAWIKRHGGGAKRNWDESGMSWMKKRPDAKRDWEDAGIEFIKRGDGSDLVSSLVEQGQTSRGRSETARGPSALDSEEMIRDNERPGFEWEGVQEGKRDWDEAGMSWIKRE